MKSQGIVFGGSPLERFIELVKGCKPILVHAHHSKRFVQAFNQSILTGSPRLRILDFNPDVTPSLAHGLR